MTKPLLRLRNITKIYQMGGRDGFRVAALQGLDLDILSGEYVSIMGPSGSGKSTLLQILGLLDRPTGGNFECLGRDITGMTDDDLTWIRSRMIGFVFQFFNLLPRTSSRDNVRLPLLYSGQGDGYQTADQLLTQVGLGQRLTHLPHQLSGGQQQRVAIARALANSPLLILADEPTGNISTKQTEEILGMFEDLNRRGITIIIVTHEPSVANRARRMITIRDGQIAEDQLLRERTHPEAPEAIPENLGTRVPQGFAWLAESFRMARISLGLNLLRTSLATLGVVIGIASFTAMMAIGDGAKKEFAAQMSGLGTNLLNVRPVKKSLAKALATGMRYLMLEDFEAVKEFARRRPELARVDSQIYQDVVLDHAGKNSVSQMVGATTLIEDMQNMRPIAGRMFTEEENKARDRVALVGPTVARNLFGEGVNPVGSVIKINQTEFQVIGVLNSKGGSAFKDRDDMVLVPLETAIFRIMGSRRVDAITVEARDSQSIGPATQVLNDFFRDHRKLMPNDPNNFEILDMSDVRKVFNESLGLITSMLQAIAMICLLVGGIGIMNVMFVSVKERTREVGLRKALGARRLNILSQFVVESVLIGVLGGFLGVLAGAGLSAACSYFLGWTTVMSWEAVALSMSFSIFVGMIFGLWPARQAAALSPIEALRYE